MDIFNDKIVVITGAGSGIGRALALEFGRLGARMAINDRDRGSLDETVSLLEDQGVKYVFAADFDVSSNKDMHSFARTIQQKWGNAYANN